MNQTSAIIGLLSQSSIHAGTGQNTGVIDLPIQREGHNGWPCVFGSAVKGALRVRAEDEYGKNNDSVTHVFGPSTNNGQDHAGAISISDARLLLLPVRSLTSQFKWVTCPAALKRYQQDASRFAKDILFATGFNVGDEEALAEKVVTEKDKNVFLEEYRFKLAETDLTAVIDVLLPLMKNVDKATLQQQLVIISDDNFSHMVQHVTPVNAHIAIDSDTKIVKTGALWYEETLPPETLLYTGLLAVASRKPHNKDAEPDKQAKQKDAQEILHAVTDLFDEHSWLQLGGNETVGMGWCAVSILENAGE